MPDGGVRLLELGWDRQTAYYSFDVAPQFEHLFWPDRELTLSCSEGVRLDAEILTAAFVFAMAPVAWTFGAQISTGGLRIPEPAMKCLERTGAYLRGHYGWTDHLSFRDIPTVAARWNHPRHHRALLWSGGVDSSFALLEREHDVDWLIHLTNFENLESRMTTAQWERELASTRRTADARGLGWMHLRTSIASLFKHNRFDDAFPPECSFWLGLDHVHHLATALSVVQPLLAEVLVSGGFNELVRRVGSCAADAAFVDLYDFPASLHLIDELVPRQQKIEALLDRAPELLRSLRVCYSSGDGTCAHCNKCQTTALMIVAGGGSLGETPFPPEIAATLRERVEVVRAAPPEEHRSMNQALDGRQLSGSREKRWSELARMLDAHQVRST